jgi:hypothetical protein
MLFLSADAEHIEALSERVSQWVRRWWVLRRWPGSLINCRAPGWPGRGNVRLSRENAGY